MNPELRRNLWLELGWHRRIAAPAVLLLVFGLVGANADPGEDWRAAVHPVALVIAIASLFLWGTREAAAAVVDEVRSRTWDLQRLSALGPWDMTWGKLVGATVFPWYVGGLCLAVVAFTAPAVHWGSRSGWMILAIVAGAVALHGAGLASSLLAARRHEAAAGRPGAMGMVVLLLFALWSVSVPGEKGLHVPVEWYGRLFDRMGFVASTALAFAAWGALGAYRAMCRELQVRTLPWAWPAFGIFVAAWAAGFAHGQTLGPGRAFVAGGLLATLGLTYVALFGDATTFSSVRLVFTRAAAGQWRRALEELPLWPSTLLAAAVFAAAAPFAFADVSFAIEGLRWPYVERVAAHAPLALVLMAARDCAILCFFAFSARPRRVEAATVLYLVLLDWVIPGLLGAVGLSALAGWVLPFDTLDGPRAAIVMAVQAGLAAWLAAWRFRRGVHPRP